MAEGPDLHCLNGHVISPGRSFCGQCGSPQAPRCSNGHEVPAGDRFCGLCGAPAEPPDATPSPEPVLAAPEVRGAQADSELASEQPNASTPSRLGTGALIAILGGCVLAGILIIAFLGSRGSTSAAQPPSGAAEPEPSISLSAHEICYNQLMTAAVNFNNNTRDEMAINGAQDPFFTQATYLSAFFKSDIVLVGLDKANENNIKRVNDWCTSNGDPRRASVDDYGN